MSDLAKAIPSIVANELSCGDEGGQLAPDDVEVQVTHKGSLDINTYDISLQIIANDYPSRKANIDSRRKAIQESFQIQLSTDSVFRGKRAMVWVLLAPGSFGELVVPTTT